MLQKTYTNIIV